MPSSGIWRGVGAVRHDGGACGDEVLGGKDGIGGPNQANLEALALWFISEVSSFLGDLRIR